MGLQNVVTREIRDISGNLQSTTLKVLLAPQGAAVKAQISVGRVRVQHRHPVESFQFSVDAFVREICLTGSGPNDNCLNFSDSKPQAIGWLGVTSITFELDVRADVGSGNSTVSALASWFVLD